MYKRLALLLFVSILVTSCGQDHRGEKKTALASHFLSITDNEDKGIKEIVGFYGGECKYGFSRSAAIGSENEDVFWIELRNSEAIDNPKAHAGLITSNIAYLFYRNLKQEKNNYTDIKVTIFRADGQEGEFVYPVSQLKHVSKKQEILEKVFLSIKEKDYNRLSEYVTIDTSVTEHSKERLINNIRETESKMGAIKSLVPYGFRFLKLPNGRELLFLTGMVVREGRPTPLTVLMNADINENSILMIDYKLIPEASEEG